MLFSSITFLYGFLPIFLLIYLLVPNKGKNYVLLLFSLIFYGWQGTSFLLLMIIVIFAGYIFAFFLEREKTSKAALVLSTVFYLSVLGYFKYSNFLIENINFMFSSNLSIGKVILPIGISFYIFQLMSYNFDVYKKRVKAQKKWSIVAAYITMFPQLIAGPIVRYQDIEEQWERRVHSVDKVWTGIYRFSLGLSKKVILANSFGECCDWFYQRQTDSILYYWIYGISFMLQIYYDFSGYSDMAIGLGKIMGFDLLENFNYPYCSSSITEFWRRWHMSLGTWFRDYVYIPLGGNRVTKLKWIRNIFVVWCLTGLWHGASWNFLLWGLMFGLILMAEKYLGLSKKMGHGLIQHLYVLFVVMISFILFNAPTVREGILQITGLFGGRTRILWNEESAYCLRSFFVLFAAGMIGAGPVVKIIGKKVSSYLGDTITGYGEIILAVILYLVSTSYLVDGSFNPFLYFRF